MSIRDSEVLGANKPGRRANRRGELLSVAARLFAERGYGGVTVDEIGAAAGVSGPSLYHHFPSKESLLGEMLIRISESLLVGAQRIVADHPAADRLDLLIAMQTEFAVDNPALITVHVRDLVHTNAGDAQRVRSLQNAYVDVWVDAVMLRATSAVDRRSARAAVHAVLGLINSTPFSARLRREGMIELLSTMAAGALVTIR